MGWYVYMLRCGDGSLYTGYTDDVERRLAVHQSGKGGKYTRSHLPVELVYREELPDKSAALRREADPECAVITKRRWLVPHGELTLEVDVFPFWQRQAFCEAELSHEEQTVELPAWMELLREVTDEDGYTNHALARQLPPEDEEK